MKRLSKIAALIAFALFVFAMFAALATLSSSDALAQDHAAPPPPGAARGRGAGRAPLGHSPSTGTAVPPTTASPEHGAAGAPHDSGGAQSGEHRNDGEGGEHAGGHHGLEDINWTDISDKKRPAYIALVINFGVLMAIYYLLGKKPVTEALKQRRVTIGKEIDEAQKLLAEAKERAKKYQGDLKNADTDAATAKASLVSSGKGEVERLLTEANERAGRMKRDADRLVDQERKQVHADLLHETVEQAVAEATQILEKQVSPDDHARLAQDLLTELSRRPAAGAAQPPRATSSSASSSGGGAA